MDSSLPSPIIEDVQLATALDIDSVRNLPPKETENNRLGWAGRHHSTCCQGQGTFL